MDAGIIAFFTRRYQTIHYQQVLAEKSSNKSNLYAADQLIPMTWLIATWNKVPQTVIKNSWRTCGLLSGSLHQIENMDVTEMVVEKEIDLGNVAQ